MPAQPIPPTNFSVSALRSRLTNDLEDFLRQPLTENYASAKDAELSFIRFVRDSISARQAATDKRDGSVSS